MKKIRADRLLANLGYGSRRDVAAGIKAGYLEVGGQVITDPSAGIPYDPDLLAQAKFDDEVLDPLSPLTLLLHKPRGYTCSHDEQGLLVYGLLPPRWQNRAPVLSTAGRLDKESTGLVIITDDGDLLHRIISPKCNVWKQYHVTLRDPLKGNETALFGSGDFLMERDTSPLKIAHWVPESDRSGFMSLQEGRYHQIRRMFATLGNHVEALHRFRIGNLQLGDLQAGAYKVLKPVELELIFAS